VGLGLNEKESAQRLGVTRWTVGRSIARLKAKKPDKIQSAQNEGVYQRLRQDSFRGLPEIARWIENLKARRIRGWKNQTSALKAICDELEIYPSMLDGSWAQKWIASKSDTKTDAQLRNGKTTLRSWLKFAFNLSDNELQVLGIDAKHYEVGKWATVALTEDQISKGIQILASRQDLQTLLVFRLGLECCTPLQELQRLKKSDWIQEDGILRTYRPKTGSYWSKYPSHDTVSMIRASPNEQIFNNGDLARAVKILRNLFREIDAKSLYFSMHPIHALRHCGAQRLLRKTDFNRAVVAVLGGWEAEKTLEDHYGAVPNQIIHKIGGALW
ncbi:MAG: site-specific integrase, partial [Planctomycetota bacterium]|jgi:integrase